MPEELEGCENMQDDLNAIESWATSFTDENELISTVTKNFLENEIEIMADIGQLESDYSTQEYFKVGEDLATLAEVLIGPIQ